MSNPNLQQAADQEHSNNSSSLFKIVGLVFIVAFVLLLFAFLIERSGNAEESQTLASVVEERQALRMQVGALENDVARLQQQLTLATNMYRRYQNDAETATTEKILLQWYLADLIQETTQAMENQAAVIGMTIDEVAEVRGSRLSDSSALRRKGFDCYYDRANDCYYLVASEDERRIVSGVASSFNRFFDTNDYERTMTEVRYLIGDSPFDRSYLNSDMPTGGWNPPFPWTPDRENELFYYEKLFHYAFAGAPTLYGSQDGSREYVVRLYSDENGAANGRSLFELILSE